MRIVTTVKKVRQPRFARFYRTECSGCHESVETPARFLGMMAAEVREEHRQWAEQHRKDRHPGGRRGAPASGTLK